MLVSPCSIVGRGSPCWFHRACRVGLWVVDREFVGCALWCWVMGGCCGWRDMVLGSAMERQRRETRDRGERELDKILLFFYNTYYSAILCLELHCSSIAKNFAILLFNILQCRWFWGLKFQISLRFGISIF